MLSDSRSAGLPRIRRLRREPDEEAKHCSTGHVRPLLFSMIANVDGVLKEKSASTE
jgi:hypothetical protein